MSSTALAEGVARRWRKRLDCQVVQLETKGVMLVGLASNKRERAVQTLRPKIRHHLYALPIELPSTKVEERFPKVKVDCFGLSDALN
jgi:hypothetical protein